MLTSAVCHQRLYLSPCVKAFNIHISDTMHFAYVSSRSISTHIKRGGGDESKEVKRGTDCGEVCNSRNLEVEGGQEEKNPIKTW